jgi:non-ribosomal peptide synthetase component E (peptide arylation enzyme)
MHGRTTPSRCGPARSQGRPPGSTTGDRVELPRHVYEVLRQVCCFSGNGFTAELATEAATQPDRIALVGLDDLYRR